jgi:hypothetical protein
VPSMAMTIGTATDYQHGKPDPNVAFPTLGFPGSLRTNLRLPGSLVGGRAYSQRGLARGYAE